MDVAGPTPVSRSARRRSGTTRIAFFFFVFYFTPASGRAPYKGIAVTVSKTFDKLANSAVKLTVTVAKDEVQKSYGEMIKDYVKNVQLPGFRKGKVPTNVLERKFGEQLKVEAMSRLMDDAVQSALEGESLVPLQYSQPELDGQPDYQPGEAFSFAITYDVFPAVTVGDLGGAELEVPVCVIAKADEERELAEIRERNAIVMDKAATAKAAKSDVATIDYVELDAEGKEIEGTKRQDFVFEIGSGNNLYKLDDDLVGLKVGAEKVIEKTFPADYEYNELAGTTKKLNVKLTKLKEKKLPELDDDLAQDVSEQFKTLDDLKADIRAKLEKRLADQLKSLQEKALIEKLLEKATVELPASMVRAELEMRLRNLMERMGMKDAAQFQQILTMSGKSPDDLFNEWRPDAQKAIKTRLMLDKLVSDSGLGASDEDVTVEYAKMAEGSSMTVEQVKEEYERRKMVDYLRDRIKEDKLLADLMGKTKLKKGKKLAFVDLVKENK
ncbi:MAG TPA: trigger factor [Spirochaetaceae bacterium]|nr:trigger factor [Spirochaetaceae bacterium]HAX38397.1 trigger factor [Spirochaetaceae bacterium]HBO42183.1 trigger factor [Spirochaetaceae bacterium]HCQ88064.1 trigger factor [Spirochaetaceae bacterium]